MSRTLYIVGTGGFAKEAAQLADAVMHDGAPWTEIAYLCEAPATVGQPMPFGKVVGTDELLLESSESLDVIIGVGIPGVRRRIAQRLRARANLNFPNLVHPRAILDTRYVSMGEGNLVTAGCIFECDIRIGDFNVFNLNTTVTHDTVIGSYNLFNPGCNLSGHLRIGDACLCGVGTKIIENLSIASNTVLGAGSVVVRSVEAEGLTLMGVPAKSLKC